MKKFLNQSARKTLLLAILAVSMSNVAKADQARARMWVTAVFDTCGVTKINGHVVKLPSECNSRGEIIGISDHGYIYIIDAVGHEGLECPFNGVGEVLRTEEQDTIGQHRLECHTDGENISLTYVELSKFSDPQYSEPSLMRQTIKVEFRLSANRCKSTSFLRTHRLIRPESILTYKGSRTRQDRDDQDSVDTMIAAKACTISSSLAAARIAISN
jgi:hypothetical protein